MSAELLLRWHSLYSLGHNTLDELKMCLMEKKPDNQVFFYFFFWHAKKSRYFLNLIGSISVKKLAKYAKNVRKEKETDSPPPSLFPPNMTKKTRQYSWTKECSGCCLTKIIVQRASNERVICDKMFIRPRETVICKCAVNNRIKNVISNQ